MKPRHLASIAAVVLLSLLSGCVTKPVPPLDKQGVHKIAIVRVKDPQTIAFENQNGVQFLFPIAAAAFAVDSNNKRKQFSEKVVALKLPIGKELTEQLSRGLQKSGYTVEVLENVHGPANDPDNIDLDKIKTDADAVLYVTVDDFGLFSSRFSPDYLPRVNMRATLHSTRRDDDFYYETLYYGVDAHPGKSYSIDADRAFAYPSFDAVMANIPEVADRLSGATRALGGRLVTEIETALR